MKYRWITAAISGGGILSLDGPIKGNRMVRAGMSWIDEDDVVIGGIALSVEDALDKLEVALSETEEAKSST